jgi:proteasome lid subunit RPN8/RPN11
VDERVINLNREIWSGITEHARKERPAECCGVLSGTNGIITDYHPLRNGADRPEVRYFATPEDLFAAMRRMRESKKQLMGIYHSHPRTPAYPSPTDVEMAFYPEAIHFIISLEPKLDVRAYRIEGSRIESLELVLN